MEFYQTINKKIQSDELQQAVKISDLPKYCASIYEVMHDDGDHGEISCVWGVFVIHREVIKHGVRFTMPGCPNAFAWTLTSENDNNEILFHLTTNRKQHEEEFVESIEEFVADWQVGLGELG